MDHVALGIDQNISVVSIFYIEQVRKNGISGETLNKIFLCLIIVFTKIFEEESVEGPLLWWEFFLEVIDWVRFRDELKKAWIWTCNEYFVGSQEDVKIFCRVKYLTKSFHQLNGKDFLAHIVIGFHD